MVLKRIEHGNVPNVVGVAVVVVAAAVVVVVVVPTKDDGGPEVVASLSTAALETLRLMWRAGGQALVVPEAKKEKDKLKVESHGETKS